MSDYGNRGWDYHVTPDISEHFSQDYADGNALRRLHDALPEGYKLRLSSSVTSPGLWFIDAFEGPEPASWGNWIGMSGTTIATAADRCLEAMKAEIKSDISPKRA